jgi:hypothetical protein
MNDLLVLGKRVLYHRHKMGFDETDKSVKRVRPWEKCREVGTPDVGQRKP